MPNPSACVQLTGLWQLAQTAGSLDEAVMIADALVVRLWRR